MTSGSASRCATVDSNPNPGFVAEVNPTIYWQTTTKKRSESASSSAQTLPKSKEPKLPTTESPAGQSDTGSEETDLSTSEGDDSPWISWFCGLPGNDFLCEVDEEFIQDDFNLYGLQGQVPFYDYALDVILDNDSLSGEEDGEERSETESAAELLYGLIHARYILTSKGLNAMHEKYKRADFGRCPQVFCGGQPCLPVGTSDVPCNGSVKIYCPKCEDIYFPKCKDQCKSTICNQGYFLVGASSVGSGYPDMDGAYIGTTFPHLYLMTYPSAKPSNPVQVYVPRVFGFKLHRNSK